MGTKFSLAMKYSYLDVKTELLDEVTIEMIFHDVSKKDKAINAKSHFQLGERPFSENDKQKRYRKRCI
jgi:hypothetical protein